MPNYRILLHPECLAKLSGYRQKLNRDGLSCAGNHLQGQLAGTAVDTLSDEQFLECLFATKPSQIFAECEVYGDGRDWNPDELSILGDMGVAIPVLAFDDGKHRNPRIHDTPLPATLLFIPGALLRNGQGQTPADWEEIVHEGRIDPAAHEALYERRLLPMFLYANEQAGQAGRKAFITLPGLGCGQFAGPFMGQMGEHLKSALHTILQRHAERLPHLRAVYYDPYQECRNERHQFDHLIFMVRPLLQGNPDKPQLCPPTAYAEPEDDFSDCQLFSVVAWDHVSWPGNDFYGGSRYTDDGVKAAATDSMRQITGIAGHYDPVNHQYRPPKSYHTWGELVRQQALRMTVAKNLRVLGA